MSSNASELAVDAMALAQIFLQSWDKLGGRSGVSREDVETVLDRANNVLLMLGAKDDQRASYQEATLDRRRAATMVFKTHRRIRIALALVLDDQALVDEIAPPLPKRKRTKRKTESSPTNTVPEEDPLDDGLDDDTEDEDAVEPVPAEPANTTRNSVLIAKGNKQFKSAVGDGLPGSSPVDDE